MVMGECRVLLYENFINKRTRFSPLRNKKLGGPPRALVLSFGDFYLIKIVNFYFLSLGKETYRYEIKSTIIPKKE